MGRGIAQIAAQAGLRVKLFDANPPAVEAARTALADTLAKYTSTSAVFSVKVTSR